MAAAKKACPGNTESAKRKQNLVAKRAYYKARSAAAKHSMKAISMKAKKVMKAMKGKK